MGSSFRSGYETREFGERENEKEVCEVMLSKL